MYQLGTTRFNTETWKENHQYRNKINHSGCIYCAPKQIKDDILLHIPIFILEMQNDKNKIMGIGLVRNAIVIGKYHPIYKDAFYNRYTYKGDFRIDREDLDKAELKVITLLEALIFKGYHHLKRGQGITIAPPWITNSKHINFIKQLRTMFRSRFEKEDDN